MLITIKEYAAKHGRTRDTVLQRIKRGGFETATKLGRDWFIDADEPYGDNRVRTGRYKTDKFGKKDT